MLIFMAGSEKKENGEKSRVRNSAPSVNQWYAVYTKPRSEKQVYKRLVEAGIETFLPLQKTLSQWSDRRKMIEKPLLSSYIFVKTQAKYFPVVYKTAGVVKFITFEGRPVPIPQYQIDNLRLLVNSKAQVDITTEELDKGDMVEVVTGSLRGLIGELIRIGSKKVVVIRLEKLEQNIIVTIPAAFLKKISKPELF